MSKISKNIKQLRNERGMTQDELAEQLHVTRQAISSWENDRTQPDIYMLGKMREIFGISIEELLYGKKRNTTLELEKPDYTGTLIMVLSVLGGLLVAVGIILVFAFFWDYVPDVVKYLFTQLPLVAGCLCFCYVYSKKREKKAWCEGGAVVSLVGVYTGLILSYEFLGLYKTISGNWLYFVLWILAVAIMFLLRSVFALPLFYGAFIFWCTSCTEGLIFEKFGTVKFLTMFVCSFLPAVAGECFAALLKKEEKETYRVTVVKWITAVYITVTSCIMISLGNYGLGSVLFWFSMLCLVFYILSFKDKSMSSPFKFIGFFGMCFIAFLCAFPVFVSDNFDLGYNLALVCFIEVLLLISAIYYRPDVLKSKIHLGFCATYLLIHCVYAVCSAINEKCSRLDVFTLDMEQPLIQSLEKTQFVLKILCLVFFALLLFVGANQKKLLEINIGFIGIIVQLMLWIFSSDIHVFYIGIVLIASGGLLLFVNLKLVKSKRTPLQKNDN